MVYHRVIKRFRPRLDEAVLKRGDKVAASARNPKALKAFVEAHDDAVLPIIRKIYADRLETWEKWEAVSNAAQGSHKA